MAEINIAESGNKIKKSYPMKAAPRVDLTPMVDLAFLLITFFMLTTSMLKQKAIAMQQPKSDGHLTEVSECQLLNILADSIGHIYYWQGLECRSVNAISLTGAQSLREKISQQKKYLRSHCLYASGKSKDLICLIKLLPGAKYDNMVKLLDEIANDKVATYAVQGYTDEELKAVNIEYRKMAVR